VSNLANDQGLGILGRKNVDFTICLELCSKFPTGKREYCASMLLDALDPRFSPNDEREKGEKSCV